MKEIVANILVTLCGLFPRIGRLTSRKQRRENKYGHQRYGGTVCPPLPTIAAFSCPFTLHPNSARTMES